jgi:hypothetical protein
MLSGYRFGAGLLLLLGKILVPANPAGAGFPPYSIYKEGIYEKTFF